MLHDFLQQEDIKDLEILQQKVISLDDDLEEWIIEKGYLNDTLKTLTLCRTILHFIFYRPQNAKKLLQIQDIFVEKYPQFKRALKQVRTYINFDYFKDTYQDIDNMFYEDNVDKLQNYMLNFYENQTKIIDLVSHLIHGSWIYGAVKCFKYLDLNFEFDYCYDFDNTLMNDAIIGGNVEIIRYSIQKGLKITDLTQCIKSHQYEIFDWLVGNDPMMLNEDREVLNIMIKNDFIHGLKVLPNQPLVLDVSSSFIEYHLFNLDNNVQDASRALIDACKYGLVDFLKIIVENYESIDINIVMNTEE